LSARALDADVYRRQGFGHALGIQGAAGLLIVDFVNGFADPAIVGDRAQAPHDASLFDVEQKYGDVLASEPILALSLTGKVIVQGRSCNITDQIRHERP
jgi:hypothetical protein